LRIFLPEAFAMLASETDGLNGQFLTVDENGQRRFALTTSGLTVIQLAHVPLSIGTVLPATRPAVGGEAVTIRGSGLQSGMTATLGGKPAAVIFKDLNTISLTTPALATGSQQLALRNPDGRSSALDAAYTSN
jgi:IPT/TIG domain